MNAFLTAIAFLVLVAVAAYVIHRLGLQHADRIAAYRYSTPRPGRRGRGTPQPHAAPWVGAWGSHPVSGPLTVLTHKHQSGTPKPDRAGDALANFKHSKPTT
ncbi:hypothetical protein PV435_31495, partial [Streptomyces scabiei]|nr:hypothetical protein [Streptomyces scabiei]